MDLPDLLTRAITDGDSAPPKANGTADRILDAALGEVVARGFDATTLEGVARRAAVNRATIYRHFGDRDRLLKASILREGQRFAADLAAAVAEVEDPADQLVEGLLAAVRLAGRHPIIGRMARSEPEQLVIAGRADGGALVTLGAHVVASSIARAQGAGHLAGVDAERAGGMLARLFAALVLFPNGGGIDIDDAASANAFATTVLRPLLGASPDLAPTYEEGERRARPSPGQRPPAR